MARNEPARCKIGRRLNTTSIMMSNHEANDQLLSGFIAG
jgi:hypothetical protein